MLTRRSILAAGLAAGATLALPAFARVRAEKRRLLILGGTSFLGPHVVEYARSRGWHVTTFNRGISERRRDEPVPADEKLVGDRDPNKGEGLKALEGKKFDAVIDTSGYYPRMVKSSAELLAPNCGHYVFISTVSVYAANANPGQDETAPIATMPDPTLENMGNNLEYYGSLKALCEQAAEAAMPGRVTNIRPGYIVGPGDWSDRFTYWPVRIQRGGDVLCPGDGEDPVQFIDVRDLAAWSVHCVERSVFGVYNALGPVGGLTTRAFFEACNEVGGGKANLVWAPWDEVMKHGLGPGMLPIVFPRTGEFAGFSTRKFDRSVANGFTSRPVKTTIKDTLDWYPIEVKRRERVTAELIAAAEKDGKPKPNTGDPKALRAGPPAERESAVLKAIADAKANPGG